MALAFVFVEVRLDTGTGDDVSVDGGTTAIFIVIDGLVPPFRGSIPTTPLIPPEIEVIAISCVLLVLCVRRRVATGAGGG